MNGWEWGAELELVNESCADCVVNAWEGEAEPEPINESCADCDPVVDKAPNVNADEDEGYDARGREMDCDIRVGLLCFVVHGSKKSPSPHNRETIVFSREETEENLQV